jgi:hypothetical protein
MGKMLGRVCDGVPVLIAKIKTLQGNKKTRNLRNVLLSLVFCTVFFIMNHFLQRFRKRIDCFNEMKVLMEN